MRRWYEVITEALGVRLVFRRWILATALVGVWPVGDRLTQAELLSTITPAGASVALSVLGLFGLITKFYLDMRDRDEKEQDQ